MSGCLCQSRIAKATRGERLFALGPVRSLGSNLRRAVAQLGGDPRKRPRVARGFVLVRGQSYVRLPPRVESSSAAALALQTESVLGEALATVGRDIIYREFSSERNVVTKVIDPRSPDGFLRIVDQIGRSLRGVTREAETDAVRRAIERLDVDWPNLNGQARAQVVRAANRALGGLPDTLLPQVSEVLGVEANRVIRGTRAGVKRQFGIKIDSDLSRTDERIARFVRESQTNFVRDEFGRRQKALSARARSIASEGIAQGLGRDEISSQLRAAFRATTVARNASYWDVVASAFVNRARSLAEVSSYADAGITHYVISAVLDEVTTDICRFLDGKRLEVGAALGQFRRVERLRDPEKLRTEQPWLQTRQDQRGNRAIFVPGENGFTRVAVVEESAEPKGKKDERGTFRAGIGSSRLAAANVGPPPYHGLCRTTTVPEV